MEPAKVTAKETPREQAFKTQKDHMEMVRDLGKEMVKVIFKEEMVKDSSPLDSNSIKSSEYKTSENQD